TVAQRRQLAADEPGAANRDPALPRRASADPARAARGAPQPRRRHRAARYVAQSDQHRAHARAADARGVRHRRHAPQTEGALVSQRTVAILAAALVVLLALVIFG